MGKLEQAHRPHWQAGAIAAVLCAIILLVLPSCGLGNKPQSAPVILKILVGFGTGTDHNQVELHQALEREFNSTHQDINIRFETLNYAEHDTKFAAMLLDGNPPDLVMPIGVAGIATYIDEWYDLAPLIGKESGLEDDLYPKVLAANRYGKKLFGLSIGVYPSVLYYNADIFDRAKLPYPPHRFGETGWTYEKLLESAAKMTKDRNGKLPTDKSFDPQNIIQYGFDGGDWSPWRAFVAKYGDADNWLSPDRKTAHLDSPTWKAAMHFVHDSIFTRFVRPRGSGAGTLPVYGDNDPLGSNRTAMWESFSWIQYAYGAWNSNFTWDIAAIPAMGKNQPVAPGNTESIAIPRLAKSPFRSWEVAKWLLQPEVLSRLSQSYGCVPARKSLAAAWLQDQKKINAKVDWQVMLDAIDWLDQPNHESWLPNYKKLQDALKSLQDGLVDGSLSDPDGAAENMNRQIQGYLDEYWKTAQP